ncbi:MAG: archaeal flagellar protein FlaI [Candidatus Woesearchaeota archaeon]|nr:archaeal flagellar protein FlaI [Candidatus Woesearchaeota archaeon]
MNNCKTKVMLEGDEYILMVDCNQCPLSASLEDNKECMNTIFSSLLKNKNVTKVVLSQKRDYEYNEKQISLLKEIAEIYRRIIENKTRFSLINAEGSVDKKVSEYYVRFKKFILNEIKSDPVGTYVELVRLRREIKVEFQDNLNKVSNLLSMLDEIIGMLERTKLITILKPYLPGYVVGDRRIYSKIFYPTIKPDFMFSKLMATYPHEGEVIDSYFLPDETEVTIFSLPDNLLKLYHIIPPELKLSEEEYTILDKARAILTEHTPNREEFTNPTRVRDVFYNVGRDLIEELAQQDNINLTPEKIDQMAKILVRYTVGFGLIEILLEDENIQDITINSPQGKNKVFLIHSKHEDCFTNIIPTTADAESWASKLRMISGRPLDEANPILDTEIEVPYARARVAVVTQPLNPNGLAFAFRRHRNKPWTLPLFIKNRMLSPLAAGLLSFLIDGSRTFLVAGTRSAGKSSLLGAMMVEVMRKFRIITIEDTLELPGEYLKNLGYNIQQLKVASALSKQSSEASATEGIRTTLRLGDSALFVGEVRSEEARALYEAMRVGALANVVAGTIHGDSPYGVYDRIVNDLNVLKTSFKATDIIIVANQIRSPDGLKRERRVLQITEVRKNWENDPLLEKGFVDLMKYDPEEDALVVTNELMNGDSEILKSIAGNVREWAGNWDAIWDNILLRAKIKEELVKVSENLKDDSLLEADFVIACNDQFHKISDKVKNDLGKLDSKEIFSRWKAWLDFAVRNREKS